MSGEQQGREDCICSLVMPDSRYYVGTHHADGCLMYPGQLQALFPGPSSTPPARDSGRECPRSSDCEVIPGRGCWTHMQPISPPSPLARDGERIVDGYGRNIGACTECHTTPSECTAPDFCCEDCLHLDEGWEGYETAPVESSGRDEAREALGDVLARHAFSHVDSYGWSVCLCGHVAVDDDDDGSHARHQADELLALPDLAAILTEPRQPPHSSR